MEEEKSSVAKEEDTFHLSNWKKLIYIMAEMEKNVVEDSQQPQSQNINQEPLSNSRWSWPWKIHKGKVISSKKEPTLDDCTQESFDNKQNKSFFPLTSNSSMNILTQNNENNEEVFNVSVEVNLIETLKHDKKEEEESGYNLRSALGFNSDTNAVAMGIILPSSNFKECMPCDNSNNTTTFSYSTPPTTLMSSFGDISDHQTQPSFHADNNNELGIRENNNENTSATIVSAPSFLLPNKCDFPVGDSSNKNGENIILSRKTCSTSCNNSQNLYENKCEEAYESKFMVDMKAQTFKENDSTSLQTLDKLRCDTKSRSYKPCYYNGLNLVGNKNTKETEGVSNSFSSSVVTEKCRKEECRHCAKKAEEKHLLKRQETSNSVTTKKSTNYLGVTATNQSAAEDTQLEYLTEANNTKLGPDKSFVNNFDHCCSYSAKVECECGCKFEEDSFQKQATFRNISIENLSEGYLKHRKFELH
jgi:hypothetical protein